MGSQKVGKGGGIHEKPIYREDCLKRGAWTICRFKEGLGKKEGRGVFLKGADTPMHTMDQQNDKRTFFVYHASPLGITSRKHPLILLFFL